MADPLFTISATLRDAFASVTGLPAVGIDPVVRPSDRADAQVNGALALAKQVGRNPREVADAVVATGALAAICSAVEVAGPGFINLTFTEAFLAEQLAASAEDARLGVRMAAVTERAVVDYSAPNVAKEMHVGHLRSTVIGDSIVRLLQFVGHEVVRENHIGDWGTPFGMLIEHLLDLGDSAAIDMSDPNPFYQAARAKFDADDDFKARARDRVVALQSGDPSTLAIWQRLVDNSAEYFDIVYRQLGVLLTHDDLMGESAYHDKLAGVVEQLAVKGLLEQSDGADVVFVPGFTNREGDPLPLIVQKGHGGFNYATSDLACVIDRVDRLGATLLVYVVGSPQAQHLAMVFKVAEMAGWLAPPAHAVHVGFGSVLGADRKMYKTRSGENVKLQALLDEGVQRAAAAVAEKNPEMPADEQAAVGRMVGIGAIKYADLSTDRIKDYVFDWDRMLAFEGNTAPYLQYAHARICSIFRRAGVERPSVRSAPVSLAEPQERSLALALLQFDAVVHDTVEKFAPHRMCTYLFDLAQAFTGFYEACPVLKDGYETTRLSRLALCDLTARTLQQGLALLGIDAPERM
ncbi:MAG: arginine--tRNA ligase [Actinobacteria bacterium]|uniref:arginine--tRNA ligase n=1 Tax=freshwater metagenome TaxID=449393 RepID=A0A6J6Y0D8_9ZZZZ|nr:arginine--tRNA ligase [Actinomycetota bacterium]MSW77156.1 arginine--tRNA ligase [Actinomycetota bacterium]MSX92013.1 arginine--tRNA ligase [Actinomycetota bacterium]MSZ82976.1 arginine--tRNA ligase [Actinomycetota bacterium]MTB17444.1 arginine--tRNA ligase [Actinomycetota bacterium]